MTRAMTSMAQLDPADLDAADPLARYRERFLLPEGVIYLDGNSLGPASHAALAALDSAARSEWAEGLIRSWNTAGWFDMPISAGNRIARLVGAAAGQVAVCDSVTVNLYKVLRAAMGLRPGRRTIVAEASSFPTDLYIAEGVAANLQGARLRLAGRDADTLEELIDEDTAVVLVNHVDYRSGALQDMAGLTSKVHAAGALAVWDLCHSAGALCVELDACEADFAVGCTYKYLNCGPGAPAFVYAATRHHARLRQPLSGWWGHARPFEFETGYAPASGIKAFLTGTPPVLSLRALAGALDGWDDVDMGQLREKSMRLTQYFIDLVEDRCGEHGLASITPGDPKARGSQVSLRFAHAYPAMQALIARGVIGDFRAPDVMRFGFTPLYLSFAEVARAVEILKEVLDDKRWQDQAYSKKAAVT
ncbi:kynureninase [Pusillimonas sp.]|uniref:kynureninase n=1 Tax=Pusillimonas sp. TaxID=3040095 RepID=UPI0029BE81EF|nr:kynureninase [Pusillimonas sp.]MDX3894245.1 kynureninase [Pusillimonas sp.]